MLPLSDGLPAPALPVITTTLIAANAAAWLLYELPGSTRHRPRVLRPCAVEGTCHAPHRSDAPHRSGGSWRGDVLAAAIEGARAVLLLLLERLVH